MKLYYAPEFSSLADHIALIETGLAFEIVRVDLETKKLAGGGSYLSVNPKGMVPALAFDDGQVLTENVAILAWAADQAAHLMPPGPLGRYRLLEMLSFIASEIHKRFPFYFAAPEEARAAIQAEIEHWLSLVAARLDTGHLLGSEFSAADPYLFVMARGAREMGFKLDSRYEGYLARIEARASVQQALTRERASSAPQAGGI